MIYRIDSFDVPKLPLLGDRKGGAVQINPAKMVPGALILLLKYVLEGSKMKPP
jgi:hypothetical protein